MHGRNPHADHAPRSSPTPSRRRRRQVDLCGLRVEDWLTLALFWIMALLRLPAVLHPLRPQRQPRLDRGDRDQLPGRRGLPRLVDVRAPVAAHPGRRPLPLPAAPAGAACLSTVVDLDPHRLLRLRHLAGLALRSASSRDERMIDDRPAARSSSSTCVLSRLCPDAAARRSRSPSATGGAAIRCSSAPTPSTDRRTDVMLLLIGSFLVLMLIGLPVAICHGRRRRCSIILVYRHRARHHRGAAHDRRRRELPAARRAVLHPRRQPDEHRRRHRAHLHLRGGAGRLDEGRPRRRSTSSAR